MLLKRIQARTLPEALERAERECGEGALLVATRRTPDGYEVVAADEDRRAPDPPRPEVGAPRRAFTPGFAALAEHAHAHGLSGRLLAAVEDAMRGTRVDLSRPGDPAVAGTATAVLAALVRARPLLGAPGPAPAAPRVIAFVGPTGVGKTTTLAKLAGLAVRDHGLRVAIVTVDTYRVAAVEQLRAYADMLGAPFEVAFTPLDLRRAVARHAEADFVLVDTSGRSPLDRAAVDQARGLLAGARPVHALCLPAAGRREDVELALAAFAPAASDAVIVTKWDETRRPGECLSLLIERGIPIAHVTVGQEVPADIVAADPLALATAAFSPHPRGPAAAPPRPARARTSP
jgi:flagellar biosynthesis protein FlhF